MSSEELRSKYLQLAEELVDDAVTGRRGSSHVVSRIGFTDVARSLGTTRAGVARLWVSEHQFWDDLAFYIAAQETRPSRDEITGFFVGLEPDETTIREYSRRALNARQQSLLHEPWLIIRAALLGHVHDDRLTPLVVASADVAVRAISDQWSAVLGLLDLVPIEPLTVRDLGAAMYCLADGLAVAGRLTSAVDAVDIRIDPDAAPVSRAKVRANVGGEEADAAPSSPQFAPAPDGGEWGLLAYAARCALRQCTRPRRDGESPLDLVIANPFPSSEMPALAPTWSQQQRVALDTGRNLFIDRVGSTTPPGTEEPITGPLANVTVANLSRRAGVSRQAVYKLWPTQSELRIDLIRTLSRNGFEETLRMVDGIIEAALQDPSTATVTALERVLVGLSATRPTSTLGYIVFAADFNDWRVKEVGRLAAEAALDRCSAQISLMLASLQRELRPSIRPFHLASLTSLTACGATRLYRSNPELLPRGSSASSTPWSPLAIIMNAFILESTVPTSS